MEIVIIDGSVCDESDQEKNWPDELLSDNLFFFTFNYEVCQLEHNYQIIISVSKQDGS